MLCTIYLLKSVDFERMLLCLNQATHLWHEMQVKKGKFKQENICTQTYRMLILAFQHKSDKASLARLTQSLRLIGHRPLYLCVLCPHIYAACHGPFSFLLLQSLKTTSSLNLTSFSWMKRVLFRRSSCQQWKPCPLAGALLFGVWQVVVNQYKVRTN